VTIPITMPAVTPVSRDTLGLPAGFLFLFSFDYLSVFERKNPLATVAAFTTAFKPGSGAALVLKCINHEHDPANHARLREAIAGRPDIQLIDAYLSPSDKNALAATCDCYVSLHRSEGLGLTMAEAMYLGKPVIATGYSGNLDFMSGANSYLVDFELVRIGPDAKPYPAHGLWAEPDVQDAARLMRHVFDDQGESATRGRRAAADIRRTHSKAAAGARMARRLESIRGRLKASQRATSIVPELRRRLARGPVPPPRSRLGVLGPPVRRAALEAMKPFTSYQRAVDDQIVQSLEELDQTVVSGQQRADAALSATGQRIDELAKQVEALTPEISKHINTFARRLAAVEAGERALPYMAGSPFTTWTHSVAGVVEGYTGASNAASCAAYRSFEDIFRGSEDFIRERQRIFLPLIRGHGPVLDFGCGRGEFLDLLREQGLPYNGIDSDPGMVERCHEKGHEQVIAGDGLEFLASVAEGSLGTIFCAQVIEHLEYSELLTFFTLARCALDGDGILIAETVNPHSSQALKTFWVDLTHRRPIFPEVALALCRLTGFGDAFVFHPNGSGDIDEDRYTQGEYAVVAQPGPLAPAGAAPVGKAA
jgi:SAM-dependent methyltransferase